MLASKKVAVTGGLSCGKSSVCRYIEELGAYVASSDEIVHQLLSPDTKLGLQVINLLGNDIVVHGSIDRRIIAQKVFDDPALLASLEKLLHPKVLQIIEERYQQLKSQSKITLFVAEIPLLFEIGREDDFESVILVTADPEICRQRFKASTGYGDEEFNKRMARQLPLNEKIKKADFIIENNGDITQLRQTVEVLYNKISSKNKS